MAIIFFFLRWQYFHPGDMEVWILSWRSRSIASQNDRYLNQGGVHLWYKFADLVWTVQDRLWCGQALNGVIWTLFKLNLALMIKVAYPPPPPPPPPKKKKKKSTVTPLTLFYPTLCWACNYVSIRELELIWVSKRGPWWVAKSVWLRHTVVTSYGCISNSSVWHSYIVLISYE